MSEEIPAPTRGGTFIYCPWEFYASRHPGRRKFRTAKAYRRHWRRQHAAGAL